MANRRWVYSNEEIIKKTNCPGGQFVMG